MANTNKISEIVAAYNAENYTAYSVKEYRDLVDRQRKADDDHAAQHPVVSDDGDEARDFAARVRAHFGAEVRS